MAKKFKTSIVISGDPSGGLKAVRVTDDELKKLDKQVDRNKRSAGELSRAYTHLRDNAGRYTLAAGAAAAGVVALTARTAAATRDTATLAAALGTSTGGLQAFQYAAKQAGIETSKAADIVKDLEDKLGDAALTGGGELAPVLDKIGLSAKQLIQEGPVQQLVDIGKAIQGLPKAEQVNILESMSDDATRLLPLLKNNAAELKRYSQQARDFHIALGDDDIARLVQADQAMKTLEGVARGLGNELAIAVAPALENAAAQAGGLSDIFSDPAFQSGVQAIANTTGFMATQLAESVKQVGELANLVENFSLSKLGKAALSRTGPGYVMEQMGIGPFAGDEDPPKPNELKPITVTAKPLATAKAAAISNTTAAVDKLGTAYDSLNGRLTQQIALFGKTSKASRVRYEIETGELASLAPARKQHLVSLAQELDQLDQQKQASEELKQLRRDLATPDERRAMTVDSRLTLINDNVSDPGERAHLAAQVWDDYTREVALDTEQIGIFSKRASEDIQDELGDNLQQVLGGHFDGILDSWTSLLQNMAAQALAANLNNALFGKEGAGSGGGLFGTIGGAVASGLGGLFGGASGGGQTAAIAGLFADGGRPPVGRPSIVGEDGPEVFWPDSAGTILPSVGPRALPMSDAATPNVYVNITNNGQPVEVERQQTRRTANGAVVVDMAVKSSLSRMASSGELDLILAPFAQRQGQI